MATLSQLIGAVNGFLAAAGLSTIAKVSIDVPLNEIEIKLAAQTELDKSLRFFRPTRAIKL